MLLVGGDSFAQFPKNLKDDYPHWAEIISNHDAISTGTGGSDLGYNSMIAMEELYQNNYTHCIFFITDFGRIPLQPVKDNMAILDKKFTNQDSPQDFYGSRKRVRPITYGGYQTGHLSIPEGLIDEVENLSFMNYHHDGNSETLLKDEPEIHNYLKLQPGFEYMHTKLSYISLLKNYCNNNNIKILFVCPFLGPNQVVDLKNFLQIEVFDIYQSISQKTLFESICFKGGVPLPMSFADCPSHFNKEQHEMIAEYFIKDYPGWI